MAKNTNILICDPDSLWSEGISSGLNEGDFIVECVSNGKSAQALLAKEKYEVLIISIETTDFSCFEVIKFLKFNNLKTKILLTSPNQNILDELSMSESALRRLGVHDIILKPIPLGRLKKLVGGFFVHEAWRQIKQNDAISEEEEINANDNQFTRVKIEDFFTGNTAIFTLYIKLSPNKYLKILNAGDFMEAERMKKYKEEKDVKFLYFKNSDRLGYIDFVNSMIEKSFSTNQSTQIKTKLVQSVTEKFIEELYSTGLTDTIVDEGIKISKNIYSIIDEDPDISVIFNEFLSIDDSVANKLFLTSIIAIAIAKNLDWASPSTIETISFGAFLYDIGTMKLPEVIRKKAVKDLTKDELVEYHKHPQYGVELVSDRPGINERVLQIIYQHHERVDASGFPSQLSGRKIFPLAKVVGLADHIAQRCLEESEKPFDVMKKMIEERRDIFLFDSDTVKSFIKGFVQDVE